MMKYDKENKWEYKMITGQKRRKEGIRCEMMKYYVI